MSRQDLIIDTLNEEFEPSYMEVENESHNHAGGKGRETHFRVLIVSKAFDGLNRVDRQRKVYSFFQAEFDKGLHAFSLRALTAEEWEQQKDKFPMVSPNCAGRGKKKS